MNAVVIGSLKTGGAESAVRNIISALDAEHRARTCLILMNDPDATQYAEHLRVPVFNLAAKNIFSAAWKLRLLIGRLDIRCVHAHLVQSILAVALACGGKGIKCVFFVHTFGQWKQHPDLKGRIKIMFERLAIAKCATTVVYVSERIRRMHREHLAYRDDTATVIPNIVCRDFVHEPGLVPPLNVVSVGRVERVKGFDWVIEAPNYDEIFRDAQWTIVGDGSQRQALERKVREFQRQNIHFVGNQSDVSPYLAQAHVFFMPSLSEGLPVALLEACKAGIPMIATRVGSIDEIIKDGQNGFLIAVGDVQDLERAFSLLHDKGLREKMSSQARHDFNEHYGTVRLIGKIQALMV